MARPRTIRFSHSPGLGQPQPRLRIQAAFGRRDQDGHCSRSGRRGARLGKRAGQDRRRCAEFLAEVSDGDARRALGALEVGVLSSRRRPLRSPGRWRRNRCSAKRSITIARAIAHYDAASALIKSIRGSDPDAAIYWLAGCWKGAKDVRFLTRRLVILASEDVGNADPQALSSPSPLPGPNSSACRSVASVGSGGHLHGARPKSNASIIAIDAALDDVRHHVVPLPVPQHLRDAHYPGATRLEHGKGYQYAHNAAEGWVDQDYLGVERTYYEPVDRGYEAELLKRLMSCAPAG